MQTTVSPQIRFLIGCPYSGSTLLLRILAEAPECIVASRVVSTRNDADNTNFCIIAKPETVIAYQQSIENDMPRSNSAFSVLPPPINYTAAKPIFLIRDPIRIFDSWKHHGSANIQSFVDCCESLFSSMNKDIAPPHVIVYEKLVQNPVAEISQVCEYWGIEYNASMPAFQKDFSEFAFSIEQEKSLRHYDPPVGYLDTVSSGSHVKSDIHAHGTLSSQEVHSIEQRLGRIYLRCWPSEVRGIHARLLRAKWFAFDLDDTLHEFRCASTAAIDTIFSSILSGLPKETQISINELKSSYAKVLAAKTSSAFIDGKTSHEYREDRIRATLTSLLVKFTPEQMAKWVSLYETSLMQNLQLKCGVIDLFTALKSLGKKIAIITEGPQDSQERTIAQLGLTPFLDLLATTNRFGVSKNDGLFERVIETTGVSGGGEFVMVGDSFERDIVSARDAGMYCVHYSENENFSAGGEVLRINSLKKLEFMLDGNH
ncbi:HAD-like protein [Periconia macrospinosa]|uniref:HAD-like protein n=1 Tax=Periconia macrospinosa TaxID=97972 RepID=A0A2V1DK47_9PLEO|nr:HAD-like protein [Periconia macrospinosa]